MFEIISPHSNVDFVGKRMIWLGLSVVAILLTFTLLFTKGLNYGIDFTGGAEVSIHVPADWDIAKVRNELEAAKIQGLRVQQIGEPGSHDFLIRAQGDESNLN